MGLEKKPFVRYQEEKTKDVVTIWLNNEERQLLEQSKAILEQSKDGTALKQLAWIGAKTIGDEKISYMLGVIYSNKRKNKRLGIPDFD